ncbi:MAG: hypothetical protein JOZ37_04260 [Actinobacteria bacterium]|nr:hypothetical protein [Actinomycetota bacterium]MBV9663160.1 hypothetical protein [Actinomycetota bacterium]
MARSSTSQSKQNRTEEQAKVDALNWLVRQLDWEESLSALRGDAPSPKRRTRATKPSRKTAA